MYVGKKIEEVLGCSVRDYFLETQDKVNTLEDIPPSVIATGFSYCLTFIYMISFLLLLRKMKCYLAMCTIWSCWLKQEDHVFKCCYLVMWTL
ncbi:uncharacterized protein LOC124438478 isoform X2 [Xenia sp. Carnegie-2017]|nr:uncharacterized protein LOC124438478 isoform X2 [Xenia sp. Carnegie-2017]